MGPGEVAALAALAAMAGALNSVAGGGSFLTFPALLFTGVPPIAANATSTVAVWPAGLTSAWAYREDLVHERRVLLALGAVSLAGGLAGALLLLLTPERTFAALVPWLLLAATLLFALGPGLTARTRPERAVAWGPRLAVVAGAQFGIAVYGGYFGGGIGFLMLAALTVLGMTDIHAMNGLKVLLGLAINGIAVVAFLAAGVVDLGLGLPMAAGALLGGWAGPRAAKALPPAWVRGFVIAVGATLTAVFFVRGV